MCLFYLTFLTFLQRQHTFCGALLCVMTRIFDGRPMDRGSIPAVTKHLSLLISTDLLGHLASHLLRGCWRPLTRGIAAMTWNRLPPSSSAEVENAWISTSTSSHNFLVYTGTNSCFCAHLICVFCIIYMQLRKPSKWVTKELLINQYTDM